MEELWNLYLQCEESTRESLEHVQPSDDCSLRLEENLVALLQDYISQSHTSMRSLEPSTTGLSRQTEGQNISHSGLRPRYYTQKVLSVETLQSTSFSSGSRNSSGYAGPYKQKPLGMGNPIQQNVSMSQFGASTSDTARGFPRNVGHSRETLGPDWSTTGALVTSNNEDQTPGNILACHECGSIFTAARFLISHFKEHHPKMKPYMCRECRVCFTCQGSLIRHVRAHSGQRPFQCDMCAAVFTRLYHLTDHQRRLHTGDKPFQCDDCKKAFTTSAELWYHTKSAHSNSGSPQCSMCEKIFVTSQNLKIHMRIHSGEKPHRCTFCDSSFMWSQSLICHKLTHTEEKP